MKKIYSCFILFLLTACQSEPVQQPLQHAAEKIARTSPPVRHQTFEEKLLQTESKASNSGRRILSTGRYMTLVKGEIVRGGCWNYADEVYKQAGYPSTKRKTIFNSNKNRGPYANTNLIQPGDWLYYRNHSYGGIEHSAIFVDWAGPQQGLMLSYGGERRNAPARYLTYNLSSVYRIERPAE